MIVIRTLLAAAILSCLAPAQVTTVAGSGCPQSGLSCKSGGSPNLGQSVGFKCGYFSVPNTPTFLLVGFEINPGIPLSSPLTCGTPCSLMTFDVVTVMAVGVAEVWLNIPPDPTLVGACLAIQGGALTSTCVDLAAGWVVCIQP